MRLERSASANARLCQGSAKTGSSGLGGCTSPHPGVPPISAIPSMTSPLIHSAIADKDTQFAQFPLGQRHWRHVQDAGEDRRAARSIGGDHVMGLLVLTNRRSGGYETPPC